MEILLLLLELSLFIISAGIIFIILIQVVAAFNTNAPFVPIPNGIEDEIINSLDLKEDSNIYDLGCGDARVLIKAVQRQPHIKAVGVEKAFLPYFLAKFFTRKYKNIEIKREDFFKTDIHEASHIFLYLYPKVINKLINNITKQCKTGTVIVSCDFELANITPAKMIDLKNNNSQRGKKLLVYII